MDPKTYFDADTVYNLNENQKNKHVQRIMFLYNFYTYRHVWDKKNTFKLTTSVV